MSFSLEAKGFLIDLRCDFFIVQICSNNMQKRQVSEMMPLPLPMETKPTQEKTNSNQQMFFAMKTKKKFDIGYHGQAT